jgi:hypothetical protein
VNGVWVQVRTVAMVTVRWFGEYHVASVCGPYRMSLADDHTVTWNWNGLLELTSNAVENPSASGGTRH